LLLTAAPAAAAAAAWLLLLSSAASPASAFRAALQPSTTAVLPHHQLLRRDLPAKALPLPPLHPRRASPPTLRSPTRRRATIDVETPATPPLEDGGDGEEEGSAAVLGRPVPYHELTVGVLRERFPGENRVSQSPDSVASLVKAGFNVVVEAGGACALSFPFSDEGSGDYFFLSCLTLR
jgi:hypothetical protein